MSVIIKEITQIIDNIVSNLEKNHFLNDKLYSDSKARTLFRRGYSINKIGYSLRSKGITQENIKLSIDKIKNDPHSRRILINLWNPKTTDKAALPSCLHQYQFYVNTKKKTLNLQIYLRSSDVFLANNWNTCTGALFVRLLCNVNGINLSPGELSVVCGDAHIYKNSIEQVKEQISRTPRSLPKLIVPELNSIDDLKKYSIDDFILEDYDPHPQIKAEMAV